MSLEFFPDRFTVSKDYIFAGSWKEQVLRVYRLREKDLINELEAESKNIKFDFSPDAEMNVSRDQ